MHSTPLPPELATLIERYGYNPHNEETRAYFFRLLENNFSLNAINTMILDALGQRPKEHTERFRREVKFAHLKHYLDTSSPRATSP